MKDFITLSCPNCGGEMKTRSDVNSYKCEYCGSEHLVRTSQSNVPNEEHAKCPICNRNDKSEKVSAILRSQSHTTTGTLYQNKESATTPVGTKAEIPIVASHISDLARYLAQPKKPNKNRQVQNYSYPNKKLLPIAILFLLIGIFSSMNTVGNLDAPIFIPAITMILGVLFFIIGLHRPDHLLEKDNIEYSKRLEEQEKIYQTSLAKWNVAMEYWDNLYYCGRDDCVYLPGENTSAPISKMIEYLYREK